MPEEVILETTKEDQGEGNKIEQEKVLEEVSSETFPAESIPSQEVSSEKIENTYGEILSKLSPQGSQTSDDDAVTIDAQNISRDLDEESKVQKLLHLANTKGVVHAVKVARSLKDYYALDKMHDELAGKLYEGLLEQGLITKE